MPQHERPLLAVLIDADNVPAKTADAILREISDIGDPALRRVYGDWSSGALAGWRDKIRDLGMVARQQSANTKGKNASDIGLVIDAMDMLHSGRFDGFVLVSSDSDFTQLAGRLREDGKLVIGIGEAKTPASLRNVCNRFILIENIVAPPAPAQQSTQPRDAKRLQEAADMFRAAMDKIDQEDEWYNLSRLGSQIRATHSDFDPRTYGSAKLSTLVRALKSLGFETRQGENHLQVRWVEKKRGK